MEQYIRKSAVVARIERIKLYISSDENRDDFERGFDFGMGDVCDTLLNFIDTLEVKYIEKANEAFIKKACEWLEKNAGEYAFVDTDRIGNVADVDLSLVQDFKNHMKEIINEICNKKV
jgi:hypothetical protein